MHIPDGFLNIPTAATAYVISAGGVSYAVREAGRRLGEKQIPLMGVLAAFIFAAQMLNFPIVGGTSGHLVGAALAAILLGPWAGLLIMSCVLIVQCLVFQDGGLVALGANVFNMGLVGCFLGYYVYRGVFRLTGGDRRGTLVGGFVAAWGAVFVASIACVSTPLNMMVVICPEIIGCIVPRNFLSILLPFDKLLLPSIDI